MTIPEQQIRYVYAGPYAKEDTVPIPFSYAEKEHVKVSQGTTLLRAEVDYAVDGQNVILKKAIAAYDTLVIYRETPLDNESEFPQEAPFDSEKINDSIDKLTMQNQEQEDDLARALKLPINVDPHLKDITFPIPVPDKGIKWNSEGTGLVNTAYDPDEMAQRAEAAAREAEYWAGQTQDASGSAQEAVAARDEANKFADWSRRWAIGNPEPYDGSAKYWASRANDTVARGFSYYTQEQWDALTDSQKQGILLAFVKGE